MEQNNLPSNPAQVTKELVKANFNISLTQLSYQKILQSIEDIEWTRENLDQDLLGPATFVAKKLTEKKDALKRPFIDAGKVIQNEYNDVFNPLNDAISRKANEKKQLTLVVQKEADEAKAEQDRINWINSAIAAFISNVTNEISLAENDKVIAAIEMRIGSESTRKNIYQEFLPSLKDQCDQLKPLIKKQKEYIKTLKELEKSQLDAEVKGEDSKAVQLREKADHMKEVIEENKIKLQEKAFEQVENSDVQVGIPIASVPKAKRTWWKWEVEDMTTLFKKNPELVDLVPNKEKIDQMLNEMKENGELDGKREVKFTGIRFFEDKSF